MRISMRLSAHFGHWIKEAGSRSKKQQWQVAEGLLYGQVQKRYQRRKLVRVKQVIRLGTESAFREALHVLGFSGRVNTAFIERVNLTIRRGVAALARRTWATALQIPHLEAHVHWWLAYYHFVRPHGSLRVVVVQGQAGQTSPVRPRYRQRTPAMAAGRTTHRWTTQYLLSCQCPAPCLRSHPSRQAWSQLAQDGWYPGKEASVLGRHQPVLQQAEAKSAQNSFAEAGRIIHHIRELYLWERDSPLVLA
jgi:hypothetical protein